VCGVKNIIDQFWNFLISWIYPGKDGFIYSHIAINNLVQAALIF